MKLLRAVLIAALFFSACNPAKKIAKRDAEIDQLKAKWIYDWVQKNPCPPGPEIDLDSVCRIIWIHMDRDGFDTSYFRDNRAMPTDTSHWFFESLLEPDTILSPSLPDIPRRFIYNGPFYGKGQIQFKPEIKYILKPVEDLRRIELMQDSIDEKDKRISALSAAKDTHADDCTAAVKAADARAKKWIWLFIAACVTMAGGITWKIYSTFHK